MSNFRSKAFNPASKRVEVAEYCDDYYGRHRYGIRFDDGCVHPEAQCGIDAAATQLDALLKEREALQARVKELEEGWDVYDTHTRLWKIEHDRKLEAAESRALRAEQERDEAYERLKPLAQLFYLIDDLNTSSDDTVFFQHDGTIINFGQIRAARELVRRLAAGPEKEGKE